MRMPRTTVAVLGTGHIGAAVAHVLLTAGFTVRVWNRSTEHAAAVVAAGAVPARTPAEAVTEADVVMTTITGDRAVASVMVAAGGGALDAMRPYCTWIQMGNISPSWTAELAGRAAARGIAFVEALGLGGEQAARAGRLLVLAIGAEHAREWVQPIFDTIGRRTVWASNPADVRVIAGRVQTGVRRLS
jgi:3-hydroxyisobutyrate dehydrogenase